jgi:hypothetical protein
MLYRLGKVSKIGGLVLRLVGYRLVWVWKGSALNKPVKHYFPRPKNQTALDWLVCGMEKIHKEHNLLHRGDTLHRGSANPGISQLLLCNELLLLPVPPVHATQQVPCLQLGAPRARVLPLEYEGIDSMLCGGSSS